MKLQLDRPDGLNTFTAYGEGYVSVNGIRHSCNLAALPERLFPEWRTRATFETLRLEELEWLASLDAEIDPARHRQSATLSGSRADAPNGARARVWK